MNQEVDALRKQIEKVEQNLAGSLTPQTKQNARNDIGVILRDVSVLLGKMTEAMILDDLAIYSFDDEDPVYIMDIERRALVLKNAIECLL